MSPQGTREAAMSLGDVVVCVAIACLALVALCRSTPGLQKVVGVVSVIALGSGFGELWLGFDDIQAEGLNVWSRIFGGLLGALVMVGMDSAILVRIRGKGCLGRAEDAQPQRQAGKREAASA